MTTGNALLDAYDRLAAEVAGLATAVKAADPEAVRRAAEAGAKAGAGAVVTAAAADVKTATTAAKEAAQKAADAAERAGRGIPRPLVVIAFLGLLAGLAGAFGAGWHFGAADRDSTVAAAQNAVRAALAAEIAEARAAADKAPEAAKWATSPAGKLARQLDRAGSLDTLAGCKGQGWRIEVQKDGRRGCIPYTPGGGSVQGWFVE
jgi:hypothetical protein